VRWEGVVSGVITLQLQSEEFEGNQRMCAAFLREERDDQEDEDDEDEEEGDDEDEEDDDDGDDEDESGDGYSE
jgi:hypothetical protein